MGINYHLLYFDQFLPVADRSGNTWNGGWGGGGGGGERIHSIHKFCSRMDF